MICILQPDIFRESELDGAWGGRRKCLLCFSGGKRQQDLGLNRSIIFNWILRAGGGLLRKRQ